MENVVNKTSERITNQYDYCLGFPEINFTNINNYLEY